MDASATNINRLFYIVSIFVISTFLWRFFVPAHEESDPDSLIYLKIVVEFIQPVGLIILFSYLRPRYGGDSTAMLTTVLVIALAASIGILVMRFSTTHGWYTGHRVYDIGGSRSQMAPNDRRERLEASRDAYQQFLNGYCDFHHDAL
ncbi:MAG TPA: hypothetical protein VM782_15830 [Stellaceae bacterium]|nr:hypothetical protein [Stellaceae bacterium]